MCEKMPKTYLEQILAARRISIGTRPAGSLVSAGPGSMFRPKNLPFEYCIAEIKDNDGVWREEILSRAFDYDAARGVVGVIAASLISPVVATYVLGLEKGGEAWLLSSYPNLSFGKFGMSVSTKNGASFAESFGITSVDIESDGAFDLVTLSQPAGTMQFLCSHNHPQAMWPVNENGPLSFKNQGIDVVVQTMAHWSGAIQSTNEFGCFQDRKIWDSFVGVIENARSAFNVTGSLSLVLIGARDMGISCSLGYRELPKQYSVFERISRLAHVRYSPSRLLRRPQHFHPALATWFRDPRFTPCIELPPREFSCREQLWGLSELENWLRLGGDTIPQIEAWTSRDEIDRSRDFISRHKRNGRKAG